MNNVYRFLIASTTVLPLSLFLIIACQSQIIGLMLDVSLLKPWVESYPLLTVLVLVFLWGLILYGLALFVKHVLLSFRRKRAPEPKEITGRKRLGMNCLSDYLPYVLPFFFSQAIVTDPLSWLLGLFLLALLVYQSATISYSPLLNFVGLQFYECQTSKNRTIIIISDKTPSLGRNVFNLVTITQDCYLL